jgi:hypothetical protein
MFDEKTMEDLIAAYRERYLRERGLTLIDRQLKVGPYRFDLMFRDLTGAKLIVEIQKGTLDRDHTYKILDYYDEYKERHPEEFVEVMLVANIIAAERKQRLASKGISYREISASEFPGTLGRSEPPMVKAPAREFQHSTTHVAAKSANMNEVFELFNKQIEDFKNALCDHDPSIWYPRLPGNYKENDCGNWYLPFVPSCWSRWEKNQQGVHFSLKYARPLECFRLTIGVEKPLKESSRQPFKEEVIRRIDAKGVKLPGFALVSQNRKDSWRPLPLRLTRRHGAWRWISTWS